MQPDDPNVMSNNLPASSEPKQSHKRRRIEVIGITIGVVLLLIGLYMIVSTMNSHGSRW